ncbi:MAG: VanZ family protein [Gammaproteobacteria bacterium]|nr:VanZ family protein [Gammaproteobacteria bacterium]
MNTLFFNPWLHRILFISWAATIFFMSGRAHIATPIIFQAQDKLVHAIAYGALAFFLAGALQQWIKKDGTRFFTACLVVILYGISDEWHQYYTPGRHADIYDVIADAVGAILGVGLFYLLSRK